MKPLLILKRFTLALLVMSGGFTLAQGAGTTLTVWTLLNPSPDGDPRSQALYEIIQDFTAETGIEVVVETLPWQNLDSQLLTAVQAGNPPDLTWANYFWLNQQVEAGTLMPLDQYVERDFTQEELDDFLLWDTTVIDGQKWTMNTSFIPKALFIRQDWLEEAGLEIPTTWDEFIEVAQAFTQDGRYGFAMGMSPTQPNQAEFLQGPIEGRGGQILNEDGTASFNDEASVETYEFLRDLVHEHGVAPEAMASMTYDDVTDAFESGRIGMIIEGSHRYSRVANALEPDQLTIARIPDDSGEGSPTVITGWTLGIPRGSEHPDAAWEFIKFFTSAEAQLTNAKVAGEIPVRTSVAEDEYFQSDEAAHLAWWLEYVEDKGTMTLNPARWTQLNELLAEGLQRVVLAPNSDVEEVLDGLVRRYNNLR